MPKGSLKVIYNIRVARWNRRPSYLNVIDVVSVPSGVKEFVAKPEDEDVLDHLLTQIMVDTEDLLLLPVGFEGFLERAGALKILAEGFLDLTCVSDLHSEKPGHPQ